MEKLIDTLKELAASIFILSGVFFASGMVALLMGDLEGLFLVLWWISVGIIALTAVIGCVLPKDDQGVPFVLLLWSGMGILAVVVGLVATGVSGMVMMLIFAILTGAIPLKLTVAGIAAVAMVAAVAWLAPDPNRKQSQSRTVNQVQASQLPPTR